MRHWLLTDSTRLSLRPMEARDPDPKFLDIPAPFSMKSQAQVTVSEPTSPAEEVPNSLPPAHSNASLSQTSSRNGGRLRESGLLGSSWSLQIQAKVWRYLEQVGLWLSQIPSPSPPQPSFTRQCLAHIVGKQEPAIIELAFYVPQDHAQQVRRGRKYPVVVNLHGGGFTLGTARDDARWAAYVLDRTGAIFVSVEYRLAPEFPFPFGVEDGVEALLHLASHADEYGIDHHRMALSGFSAGGNMAFTIPLRLQTHLQSMKNETASKATADASTSSFEPENLPHIVCIIAWYPSLDQRLSRAERRAACSRPDKTLSDFLTSLFDAAWLPDPESKTSPFASPAAATDEDLQTALPHDIAFYLCEWDMLFQEGVDFQERLVKLGKRVHCTVIEGTQHAFDKSPYPFSVDPKVPLYYGRACEILREAFGG